MAEKRGIERSTRQGTKQDPSPHLWYHLQRPISDCLGALGRHVLAVDPPLRLEHRLDDVLAAAAQTQTHGIVGSPAEQALPFEELDDLDTCLQDLRVSERDNDGKCPQKAAKKANLEAWLALEQAPLVVDETVIIKNINKLEVVALSSGKIIRVMGWSNLQLQTML